MNEIEINQHKLLSMRISDLSLKIQGTCLEALVNELYRELENAGISFKPKTYLSDEWGCPQDIPVIGIPFYLADPELCKLEGQLTGIEAESEAEIMMFLRHEAGHAFNYAYLLHSRTDWKRLFGRFMQAYKEEYKTFPFSTRFVRHVPGWYAQKHPDEDFAETFAVWLTPGSDWREKYAETPALNKLLYVERIVHRFGRKPPVVSTEKLDKPVQDLTITLDTWFETAKVHSQNRVPLKDIINEDLRRLFPASRGRMAWEVLESSRTQLIRDVNFWTGADRHLLSSLFNELLERVKLLGLQVEDSGQVNCLLSAAVFIATLAMNHQITGHFILE